MSVNMPAKYNGVPLVQLSADAGSDVLGMSQTSAMVRPSIRMSGGKSRRRRYATRKITKHHTQKQHKKHTKQQKHKKQKGGFLPSVGEGFAALSAKYITPVALFGLYRFVKNRLTRKR